VRCAEILTAEVLRRSLSISIIGIPKTIDNDLHLIQKTFGFDTAISESVRVLQCAHAEAKGAFNGIGLVKIMGRQSGHIACGSALAQNDVNFLLIPEVPFDLDGPKGLLQSIRNRLAERGHAVILVAEGAGQDLMRKKDQSLEKDASGNVRLLDIGVFLKGAIERTFKSVGTDVNTKIHRPELYDPQCAGQRQRQHLLRRPRAVRGSRRNGRETGMLVAMMKRSTFMFLSTWSVPA